ncbi:MAG TPA: M1 family metallopeptidase [Actinomycetota bacterium]|nr:M1 family metallopeptidase [Actinomycetota bacterium]
MLAAAREVLVTRPRLWVAAGLCALLAALPGAAAATFGAAGGVAFLLTGDAGLALRIWEHGPGLSPAILGAAGICFVAGFVVWARLYAIAVYLSRPGEAPGWDDARGATRRSWWTVLWMHVQTFAVLVVVAVAVSLLLALAGPAAFGTLILLGAVAFAIFRTIVRILLSVALRAVVFDGVPALLAWRSGARFVKARRHDVAVTWVGLVAIGVSLWIGGRLITPVLQETAFDYDATSGYELARQVVQLLVALPLETALLGLGVAAWTALYDGATIEPRGRARAERRAGGEAEPWVRKALAAGVVLALVGNGGPTLIADAHDRALDEREDDVARADVKPEDVADASPAGPPPGRGSGTVYVVEAVLEDDELEWTTTIDYVNRTGDTLDDVGVNVYTAAYARPLRDIPFARDLVASDFNGEFQARARSGEISRFEVTAQGRETDADLDGTSVVVDLPRPLEPLARTRLEIAMTMELPRFPERFGRWRDLTLLGNWIPHVAVRRDGEWLLPRFGSVGDPFVSETADYQVRLTVDENEGVVGSGSLLSVEDAGGGARQWRFAAPDLRDAAFVVGPFLRGLEADAGGTVVRSWYPAGRGLEGAANLEAAVSAVEYYTDTYGRLPWPEVEVVETEGRLGGMEYPGVVFVSSASEPFSGLPLLPDLVSYAGFEEARSRYVVAHELAHQWWYASVGSDQVEEPWLDEALAEASTRMWLEGEDGGERTWLMTNLSGAAEPSREAVRAGIGDFASNEDYVDAIYHSGAEVLVELRRAVGQDTYDEIMRAWHLRNGLGTGTIDELARVVVDVAGDGGRAFVERWLAPQ